MSTNVWCALATTEPASRARPLLRIDDMAQSESSYEICGDRTFEGGVGRGSTERHNGDSTILLDSVVELDGGDEERGGALCGRHRLHKCFYPLHEPTRPCRPGHAVPARKTDDFDDAERLEKGDICDTGNLEMKVSY